MNLSELKTNINDSRRDTTNSFITDDEVKRYLNKGLRWLQIQNDWDFTQTSASVSYTEGSNNYKLSAIGNNDLKSPINLFYQYQYHFNFVSPEDFAVLKNYNYDVYSLDGQDLLLESSFGSGTLTFNYYSRYTAKTSGGSWIEELSSSTDEPLIPELYQDIIIDYALTEIFRKESKIDDYKISKEELNDKLNNLKRIYKSKAARLLNRMKNPREYVKVSYDSKEDPLRTSR